jgi:chemotaxis protein MotB
MYKKLLAEQGPGTVGPIRLLPQPLHEALQGFAAEHPEMVEYLPSRGMVKFKSDLTFKPGSDFVTDEAQANLRQFVEILQNPAAREFHVYVAGHTDNMPIQKPETKRVHPNNWYLSVHRAVAVQDVLADAGLDEERMAAMGFGKWHPLVPNKPNQGGHPKNRRVEIFLVSPDRLLTVPQAQPLENDAPAEGS